MAAKKLRNQVRKALLHIAEALVMLIICIYCGFQSYWNGTGTRSKNGGPFSNWLYAMEDQGNDTVVKAILLGMFAIAALAALAALIYHLMHVTPRRTRLGQSIQKQAEAYESLKQLIVDIDSDLIRESYPFGKELTAGSQWILSEEAMRINRIRDIALEDHKNDYTLIVTDHQDNRMEISFALKKDRNEAAEHLRRRLSVLWEDPLPNADGGNRPAEDSAGGPQEEPLREHGQQPVCMGSCERSLTGSSRGQGRVPKG